jgi:hypothetical protein
MVLRKYGVCTHCSNPVSLGRLRADPSAALCVECAAAREGSSEAEEAPTTPLADTALRTSVPPEFRDLDDAEIAALVHECFREEVGAALQNVRVVCRHGRVVLAGEVASDGLRQVALQIVGDEMGFDAMDRMRVTGAVGEAAARGNGAHALDFEADELGVDITDVGGTSEDIFEVEEEGLTYTPPARPVPEDE